MGFLLETGFEDTCVIERAQKFELLQTGFVSGGNPHSRVPYDQKSFASLLAFAFDSDQR
jgi:hypothetical protein